VAAAALHLDGSGLCSIRMIGSRDSGDPDWPSRRSNARRIMKRIERQREKLSRMRVNAGVLKHRLHLQRNTGI
jgi:hypothetical protein